MIVIYSHLIGWSEIMPWSLNHPFLRVKPEAEFLRQVLVFGKIIEVTLFSTISRNREKQKVSDKYMSSIYWQSGRRRQWAIHEYRQYQRMRYVTPCWRWFIKTCLFYNHADMRTQRGIVGYTRRSPHCSAELLVSHGWVVLLLTPQTSDLGTVHDPEYALFLVFPANHFWIVATVIYHISNELPQVVTFGCCCN